MSLRAQILAALEQAYAALDDLPVTATYRSQTGEPVRDIAAGTSTLAFTDHVLKRVIFTKFSSAETDKDDTLKTDTKMIILSNDLGVPTNPADTVVDDEAVLWQVIARMRDPAKVVQIIRLRST